MELFWIPLIGGILISAALINCLKRQKGRFHINDEDAKRSKKDVNLKYKMEDAVFVPVDNPHNGGDNGNDCIGDGGGGGWGDGGCDGGGGGDSGGGGGGDGGGGGGGGCDGGGGGCD